MRSGLVSRRCMARLESAHVGSTSMAFIALMSDDDDDDER